MLFPTAADMELPQLDTTLPPPATELPPPHTTRPQILMEPANTDQ